jgi:hypothetical protein
VLLLRWRSGHDQLPVGNVDAARPYWCKLLEVASAKVSLGTLFERRATKRVIALPEAVTAEHRTSTEEASHAGNSEEATRVVMRAGQHVHQAHRRDAPSIPFTIGLPSMPPEPAPKGMLPAASPPLGAVVDRGNAASSRSDPRVLNQGRAP